MVLDPLMWVYYVKNAKIEKHAFWSTEELFYSCYGFAIVCVFLKLLKLQKLLNFYFFIYEMWRNSFNYSSNTEKLHTWRIVWSYSLHDLVFYKRSHFRRCSGIRWLKLLRTSINSWYVLIRCSLKLL